MKVIIHFKQQKLEGFLERINALNELYISRSYEFEKKFILLMKNCQEYFGQIGDSSKESEMSLQRNYFETVLKGINPQTLEKVNRGRRENVWIGAFHCLSNVSNSLQESLQKAIHTLESAKEMLSQIILSSLQSKLITQADLENATNLDKTKFLWQGLAQNEQIKLVERKLKLSVNEQDIFILLDKIINTIK